MVDPEQAHPRVAIVQFSPSGGHFHFDLQLADGLATRGCRVVLLTGSDPEFSAREAGCTVLPVLRSWYPGTGAGPAWTRPVRRCRRAAGLGVAWGQALTHLIRLRPEVVFLSGWRCGLDGLMVSVLRRALPGAVLAVTAHEPVPLSDRPGDQDRHAGIIAGNRLLRRAYHSVDVIFVLGPQTRDQLLAVWQAPAPVVVIRHGDEGIFARRQVRPVEQTDPTALFFGTITPHKGWETLLQAWPTVLEQVPGARLVMAGRISDGVDHADLRARVDRLPSVHLHPDYVDADQVPDLFEQARVVALPYLRGSQSGVAALAQTFARPVVATRVGDIPSIVVDGVSGLLCEPGDAPALAEAITSLLTDPQLAARLAAAGHEHLTRERSWAHVAAEVLANLPSHPRRSTTAKEEPHRARR